MVRLLLLLALTASGCARATLPQVGIALRWHKRADQRHAERSAWLVLDFRPESVPHRKRPMQAPRSQLPTTTAPRTARASTLAAMLATLTLLSPASSLADGSPIDAATVARARARYRHEPSVERVVAAALRATRATGANAMAARARAAGWVPRLTLRARRGQAVDLSDGGESVRVSTDDDFTLEASLVFELDRIVFRREETTIFRDARSAAERRQELAREVAALYYERRRLQLERDLRPSDPLATALRIAELEAQLDIFTNGAFAAMMVDARWKTEGSTPATRPRSPRRSSSTATPSSARPATSPEAVSPSSSPSPSTKAATSSSP